MLIIRFMNASGKFCHIRRIVERHACLAIFVQGTRSPSYLDDAHGADIQQKQKRVKRKKRADPDGKLLEHRVVTVFELATERPNSTEGGPGSITIQK